jgi:phosphate starvation-inducible protein PhoH
VVRHPLVARIVDAYDRAENSPEPPPQGKRGPTD